MESRCLFYAVFLVLSVFCAREAFAGVSVVQHLSFGSFTVKRNDAPYDITINAGGSYSYSTTGYIMISPPQNGIYDIDGLPISQAVASVTASQAAPLSGSGDNFQMVNFSLVHDPATDVSGVLRVQIGATARSSGMGTMYPDQTYTGQIDIQVNF